MKRHRTASSQDEMLGIEDLNLIADSLDIRKTKGIYICNIDVIYRKNAYFNNYTKIS